MELIIKILGISCLGFCISQFTPLQRYLDNKNEFIKTLFSCCLCLSFWIGILCTQNIFYAAIAAVLSSVIANKIL